MNYYTNLLIIFLSLSLSSRLQATDWNLYGFEMGLSHRNVLHINQDDAGFLWIGTINGLNRFDGYTFRKYDLQDSTGKYDAQAVYEVNFDEKGNLILSLNNRLLRMDRSGNILQVVDFGASQFKRGEERLINNLIRSENGWWAVLKDASDGSFSLVELNKKLEIIYKWDLGLINQVSLLRLDQGKLFFVKNYNELRSFDVPNRIIEQPFETTTHRLINFGDEFMYLAESGIYKMDGSLYKSLPDAFYELLNQTDYLNVFSNGKDRLILYTDENLYAWDLIDNTAEYLSEAINKSIGYDVTFQNFFSDQSGLLWVSTNFGAISIHFDNHDFTGIMTGGDKLCSSDYCSMRGITQDSLGNIYCSFYNSIAVIDPYTDKKKDLGLEIKDDPYGLLWYRDHLFTGSGLVLDLKSDRIIKDLDLEGEGVIERYGTDSIYLFNGGSIYLWNENGYDFEQVLSALKFDISFAKSHPSGENILIGTKSNGLWVFDPSVNQIRPSSLNPLQDDFSTRRINTLDFTKDGDLLVGTDKGIFHFGTDVFKGIYNVHTIGLPNHFINGMLLELNRFLWCSTDQGLACIDLANGSLLEIDQSVVPFSEFNRISFCALEDGSYVFGGLNGLVRFRPEEIREKQKSIYEASIMVSRCLKYNDRIDSLILEDRMIRSGDTLIIDYYDSFFQIDLSSSAFGYPKQNVISYQLEGYDNDWIKSSDLPSARYNFVPAGQYTLKVKGEVFGDSSTIRPFELIIIVRQAFYEKLWFIILCIGAIIALTSFVIRYRLQRIKRRAIMLEEKVDVRTKELQIEKKKSEDLLLNILPYEVAEELKEHGSSRAKKYKEVTVLFTDFKGFTRIASETEPEELVSEIDYCFRGFDQIVTKYKLEKIKTIGDAYLCVGGIEHAVNSQAKEVVLAALEIQEFMERRKAERKNAGAFFFEIRLGLHTGPIVAGIVGLKKFAFDIWGDTVNTASHIESSSQVGCVNISEDTYQLIRSDFNCTYRGKVEMKNKEPMDMFFVDSIKEESPLFSLYKNEVLREDFN